MAVVASPLEKFAFAIVSHVAGVDIELWDNQSPERQGVVDGHIAYPSGRQGALEVSSLGEPQERQLYSLLARLQFRLPSAGHWWWTLTVDSPRRLPGLKRAYAHVIQACEAVGAVTPEDLPVSHLASDPDVRWFVEEAPGTLRGYPQVSALKEDGSDRGVTLLPPASGGAVDESLSGLTTALAAALSSDPLQRRIKKLTRDPLPERQLFLVVHESGLPFAQWTGLAFTSAIPVDAPPIPEGITHLWLAPGWGESLLWWGPDGWARAAYPVRFAVSDG